MKYISALLLFSVLFLCSSCLKKDVLPQLPPITQTGANTFGCLVNGNVYLPYGSVSTSALICNAYIEGVKNPEININTGNRKNGNLEELNITLNNIKDTGTYKVYNYLNNGLVYLDNNQNVYEPFDTFGVVTILRCDTIQNIISGIFSFIGYTNPNHSMGLKVSITDGRFDLHYPLVIH